MSKSGGFLLGAIIGGTAAAAAALLLAPKSGKELREELAEHSDDWRDVVSDYVDVFAEKSAEWTDLAKSKVEDLKTQDAEGTDKPFRDESDDLLSNLKQQSVDLSERFKKAADEVSEPVQDIIINAVLPDEELKQAVVQNPSAPAKPVEKVVHEAVTKVVTKEPVEPVESVEPASSTPEPDASEKVAPEPEKVE
jgi:gas vesicle protein